MIIIYDKASGDLVRFVTGACLNAETFETDGHLNVRPGGRYDAPPAGQGVFSLDENAEPVLADAVAAAIYGETGRYYIAEVDGALSLLEVADG